MDTVGTFRDKSAALRTISTFDLCRRRLKSPSDGIGKLFFKFPRQPGLQFRGEVGSHEDEQQSGLTLVIVPTNLAIRR